MSVTGKFLTFIGNPKKRRPRGSSSQAMAMKRVLIKRQLRRAGYAVPAAADGDLKALRKLRAAASFKKNPGGRMFSPVTGAVIKTRRRVHRVRSHSRPIPGGSIAFVHSHDRNPKHKNTMAKRRKTHRRKSRKGFAKNPFALNTKRRRRGTRRFRRNPASGGSFSISALKALPWKSYAFTAGGAVAGAFAVGKVLGSEADNNSLINKLPGMKSKMMEVPSPSDPTKTISVGVPAHALLPDAYRALASAGIGFAVRKYAHKELGEGIIIGGLTGFALKAISNYQSTNAAAAYRGYSAARIQPVSAPGQLPRAYSGGVGAFKRFGSPLASYAN